jgi:carbon-monoxide dehydrogenase medium subunit
MLPEFASVIPESRERALTCLSSLENARILAGGTDLLVQMRRGESFSNIIDVSAIADLKGISEQSGNIIIGSTTTHRAISIDPLIRTQACSLALACGWVGSPAIRNMGTIGGNLVNASPAADSLAPLLIHDARMVLESNDGIKRMELEYFILGPYKTAINARELLTVIEIKGLTGYREGYKRVTKRARWAISRLSIAWAIHEEDGVYKDVKLAIGSCTPMPFRPKSIEESLKGRVKSDATIKDATEEILEEIKRISGMRTSFVYKMPVVRDLLSEILRGDRE